MIYLFYTVSVLHSNTYRELHQVTCCNETANIQQHLQSLCEDLFPHMYKFRYYTRLNKQEYLLVKSLLDNNHVHKSIKPPAHHKCKCLRPCSA